MNAFKSFSTKKFGGALPKEPKETTITPFECWVAITLANFIGSCFRLVPFLDADVIRTLDIEGCGQLRAMSCKMKYNNDFSTNSC